MSLRTNLKPMPSKASIPRLTSRLLPGLRRVITRERAKLSSKPRNGIHMKSSTTGIRPPLFLPVSIWHDSLAPFKGSLHVSIVPAIESDVAEAFESFVLSKFSSAIDSDFVLLESGSRYQK
ncbi:hypothetical protein R3P38DRAFT_2788381 [Favolaschia claudopus]|uniref:Uncharacterized protein n=1 Tax=Favolaschia claudopus TaxID=2862362 RepID=A0AAW0AJW1_9AGAR